MLVRDIVSKYLNKTLTEDEAELSGIPWPLWKGWLDKEYIGTPEQAKRFIRILEYKKKKALLRKQIKKQERKKYNRKSRVTSRTVFKDGFYSTEKWRALRYKVLSQHDGKCCLCGRTAKQSNSALHVDHIVPRSKDPSLQFEITNLQVLCIDCNLGKSNRDSKDWR